MHSQFLFTCYRIKQFDRYTLENIQLHKFLSINKLIQNFNYLNYLLGSLIISHLIKPL